MRCAEFRRLFGANPRRAEPEVLEHRTSCTAGCPQYALDMERLDGMLSHALEVAPPRQSAPPWEQPRTSGHARWYALAASLLVVVAAAATLWFARQREALYAEVVLHADGERNVMIVTDKRFDPVKAEQRLAKIGTRQLRDLPLSTVRVCKIRGVSFPHLIMQTPDGPVHVMIFSSEHSITRHAFEKGGYEGVIVPDRGGSIAVVGENRAAVTRAAELAVGSFQWPR